MRWECTTHKIKVEEVGNRRKFSPLWWEGTPNCVLFRLKEYKEGKFNKCIIKKV